MNLDQSSQKETHEEDWRDEGAGVNGGGRLGRVVDDGHQGPVDILER